MKYLIFYICFVLGIYVGEWLEFKYNFKTYRNSSFKIIPTLLVSPLLFPIQVIKFILK